MSEKTNTGSTLESIAIVTTDKASRYLQQLCKHFGHKTEVTFDSTSGYIVFTGGDCRLAADETSLRLSVTAPDAEILERLQDVAARHLERFAFREEMQITWQRV